MKLLSWNVNGMVAAYGHGLRALLDSTDYDIYAFQETKLSRKALPLVKNKFYSYWAFCQSVKGYSGTLIMTRARPQRYTIGFAVAPEFDCEGRLITLEYPEFYVMDCYMPNTQKPDTAAERRRYRREFDCHLKEQVDRLRQEKPVIICGDLNVTLSDLDVYEENERAHRTTPFMSFERDDLLSLMEHRLVDPFRVSHPGQAGCYTWWSQRHSGNRAANRGWRLDYFLVDEDLQGRVRDCSILREVRGSDHCPIGLDIDLELPEDEGYLPKTRRGLRRDIRAFKCTDLDGSIRNADLGYAWEKMDWKSASDKLKQMQKELAQAALDKDAGRMTACQKTILDSLEARALAVKSVSSHAAGAGIDGVKWLVPREKMAAALSLASWREYQATPAWIFKNSSRDGKVRSYHVQTWYDRAMQKLFYFALDPIAEVWADRTSYGFRKGRGTADVNEKIKEYFQGEHPALYAFKGDVKQCFDHIDHEFVMKHVPIDKHVLHEFLEAGFILNGEYFPEDKGVGTGMTISTVIANMTLDGMQAAIYRGLYGRQQPDNYNNGRLIRFADDFLITTTDRKSAIMVRDIVRKFLKPRGLQLNEAKSEIVSIADGFDFLSRHYTINRGVIDVQPSANAVERFKLDIEKTIKAHVGSCSQLISKLNKKIDGWTTYHKYSDSMATFCHLDEYIRGLLAAMCLEKHRNWTMEHVEREYFIRRPGDGLHCFTVPQTREDHLKMLRDTVLTQHKTIFVKFNPYLDTGYYEYREKEQAIRNVTGVYKAVWNRQQGLCYHCLHEIKPDQEKEIIEVLEPLSHSKRKVYVHARCRNLHVEYYKSDTQPQSAAELGELIDRCLSGGRVQGQKFLPLFEYFMHRHESCFTLKFEQIEAILGAPLGRAAECKTWWLRTGFMNISQSWLNNGYAISALDFRHRRVSFLRVAKAGRAAKLPEEVLAGKMPEAATAELEHFTRDLITRYGLGRDKGDQAEGYLRDIPEPRITSAPAGSRAAEPAPGSEPDCLMVEESLPREVAEGTLILTLPLLNRQDN